MNRLNEFVKFIVEYRSENCCKFIVALPCSFWGPYLTPNEPWAPSEKLGKICSKTYY